MKETLFPVCCRFTEHSLQYEQITTINVQNRADDDANFATSREPLQHSDLPHTHRPRPPTPTEPSENLSGCISVCVCVCVEEEVKVFDEGMLISGRRGHMGTVERAHRSAPICGCHAHMPRLASFVMLPLHPVTCSQHDDLYLHKQPVGRLDSSTNRPALPHWSVMWGKII